MQGMTENRRKRPRDTNQLAKLIADIAAGDVEDRATTPEEEGKDPAAVARGRKGGKAGGLARKEAILPERRKQIAKIAARARWGKPDG